MPSSSFRETWLGFVAVLVRLGFLEDVLRRQVLQQVRSQFHRSYDTLFVAIRQPYKLSQPGACAHLWPGFQRTASAQGGYAHGSTKLVSPSFQTCFIDLQTAIPHLRLYRTPKRLTAYHLHLFSGLCRISDCRSIPMCNTSQVAVIVRLSRIRDGALFFVEIKTEVPF